MNLYKEMTLRGVRPTVVTYSTLLSGLFMNGNVKHAKKLFGEMQLSNVLPNLITYHILVDGYCKNGCVLEAVELFYTLINRNIQPNITTFNCLINGLCKTGRLNIAWEMFNGFCKEGKLEMASKCFSDMEQNGVAPNLVTFNTLMSGFLQNNETLKVVELLHKMKERNVKPDASVGSIMLDLLGKHEDYREVLNLLPSFSTQEPTGCRLLSKCNFQGSIAYQESPGKR
ncbi:pentatricopeptide repeat-containing protein At1g62930, chloroplastic-like [Mangifera indica]|uniref:pentatricopeptide repeat-containing protein At1g62930, chloroplastic-like n=1 Tax=Mangifera indica TaxID=29780 RepID=UPI001CFB0B66|nr:pentatricopeptide repeat-containing protein At1g62930, chloroplastic-like [Mangifera indica]